MGESKGPQEDIGNEQTQRRKMLGVRVVVVWQVQNNGTNLMHITYVCIYATCANTYTHT